MQARPVALLIALLAGCDQPAAPPAGGDGPTPSVLDADEDGYGDDVDCDDSDADVHPLAYDPPRDGVDQDCDGADGNVSPLDAVADAIFYGPNTYMTAGEALLADVDITADGIPDLIIGAPSYAGPDGVDDVGFVHVVAGSPALGGVLTAAVSVQGYEHHELGSYLSAGDYDGDGDPDLLTRSRGDDFMGTAWLLHGPFTGPVDLATAPTIDGSQANLLGQTYSIGDWDGDGSDDIAVSIPDHTFGDPIPPKKIHVFSGGGLAGVTPVEEPDAILEEALHVDPSAQGFVLGMAGDVNGDGVQDWLVGDYEHEGGGRVWVTPQPPAGWSSLEEQALGWWEGEHDEAYTGIMVRAVGDVDGDGAGDWLVGAHYVDTDAERGGRAYLLTQPPQGGQSILESAHSIVAGTVPYGWLGIAAPNAGDLDGDGRSDLVVSAPGDAYRSDEPGSVLLFLDPAGGIVDRADADVEWKGGSAGDLTGRAVAVGDLNADGWNDVAVGVPWLDDSSIGNEGRVYVFFGPDF